MTQAKTHKHARYAALAPLMLCAACNTDISSAVSSLEEPDQVRVTAEEPFTQREADPIVDAYVPLVDSDANGRAVSGSAITLSVATPNGAVGDVTGRIEANGQNLTLRDAEFNLQPLNGSISEGQVSNSAATVLVSILPGYDFVARYAASNPSETTASVGVFGIATEPQDMPSSGAATYAGLGELTEVYGPSALAPNGTLILHRATATMDVNFATGKVNVALTNSDPITQVGSQVDRMSLRGATVSGTGFTGTNVKMFDSANQRIYPTGNSAQNSGQGTFYGAKRDDDGSIVPAEVGGVLLSSGASSRVFGSFVAR